MLKDLQNANLTIAEMTITGHGSQSLIQLSGDGSQVLTMAGSRIMANNRDWTDLLDAVLAPNATVNLQGCHTGQGDGSLAEEMSEALPGRTVIGSRRFALRISQNTVININRVFRDGEAQ